MAVALECKDQWCKTVLTPEALERWRVGSLPSIYYVSDYISQEEEGRLWKEIYSAPAASWKCMRNRRLQNWGGIVTEKGLIPQSLPQWLKALTERLRRELGLFPSPINHVLINEYKLAQGIMVADDPHPLRQPLLQVKVLWTYTGKKEESVLHWIAAVESYVYGQRIPYWDRVLMATSCMADDAMSFAISLQKESNCDTMIAYSQRTRIEDFFKAVRERFEDKNLARRTEMLILNIADRKWKSASALKATMDELLQCAEHGLTPTQILNNFARALPDPLHTQLYSRTKEEGMTYEKFSKIAIYHAGFLAEANYCHYWRDLQAGKKWQNRTISGNIPGKDNLFLTFEEGGVETLSYDQIDYGMEGGPNSTVVQEGDYAAVATRGGGRQGRGCGRGRGRGRGRGGRGCGGRGPGTQRGGGEGSYYVGGRGNGPSQGGRGSYSTWGRGRGAWYGTWDKPYPPHPSLPEGEPWKKVGITKKFWQERKAADQCRKCGDPNHIVPYCPDYKILKGNSQ
ncbi:hypothetical protein CBR_g45550 [Chara braunii]|uniref:Uncharacterized protein n=1 Tax=Chara braunii TaxID=69332 RepID=A0A388LYZ8_CHABU|nr:hypothetical protein CBR_g45550 [Chara braunii]|eukprot:GBG87491.1 hypothetical protein CBR_g45550 [Chara braunii]